MTPEEIKANSERLANASPVEILKFSLDTFGSDLVLACSFGPEDAAMIHMLNDLGGNIRIITLDTGRLPEETYEVADAIRFKYGVDIESYFPQAGAVEEMLRKKGPYSFKDSVENRKECCFIRKVEPLKRALKGAPAWITGRRKDQSVTRTAMDVLEADQIEPGSVKISPLASWSEKDVWEYVRENKVPYNKLFDKGYRSIGCAPCTRAVAEGEDERAGRWWWENPEHKECGIHRK